MDRPSFRPSDIEAVAFDLLTALIDSWSLWIEVAGDEALGRAWRGASLRRVTGAGDYRPYEDIVRAAAAEMDLPPGCAEALLDRWGELEPWPEVPGVLQALAGRRLAVITNCSQSLAERAAAATGASFEVVVSAERAGAYKTDPRAYEAGLSALGLPAGKVLFVAGSAHDVTGAGAAGLPVYWSNRQRLEVPAGAAPPVADAPDLGALPGLLLSD
ncbi:MAG: HAD-IA family hydrolase [Proteobacteria bacterium]|nr:HAD-IA family hydrolase [Pseudomonadota bacterium]